MKFAMLQRPLTPILLSVATALVVALPAFATPESSASAVSRSRVDQNQVDQIRRDKTINTVLSIPVEDEVAIYTDIVNSGAQLSASDFLSLQATVLLYTVYGDPVLTVKNPQLYQAFLDFLPYPPTREVIAQRRVSYDALTLALKTERNNVKALVSVLHLDKKAAKSLFEETRSGLAHLF